MKKLLISRDSLHVVQCFFLGGVFSYKRLLGMCPWMGLHFHDLSDNNGVAFSIELLEWGCKFSDFWGK